MNKYDLSGIKENNKLYWYNKFIIYSFICTHAHN